MKKNVLVTLADRNYIDQAKQLFSSVYFNSGWKGDYLLLSHQIPEKDLKWFRDKGILIKKCKPLINRKISISMTNPVVLDKFYLFTEEFKRWEHIIFLDSDIIVKSSLNGLLDVKKFGAVFDSGGVTKIHNYFYLNENNITNYLNLIDNYDLNKMALNSGVFSFNTNIINRNNFKEILELFGKYESNSVTGEQEILNLYFYKRWKRVPYVYNLPPKPFINFFKKRFNIKGIILHFHGQDKPWQKDNFFFNEWTENFNKSSFINLNNRPKGESWGYFKIILYSVFYRLVFILNIYFGKIGILWRNNFPRTYRLLNKLIEK